MATAFRSHCLTRMLCSMWQAQDASTPVAMKDPLALWGWQTENASPLFGGVCKRASDSGWRGRAFILGCLFSSPLISFPHMHHKLAGGSSGGADGGRGVVESSRCRHKLSWDEGSPHGPYSLACVNDRPHTLPDDSVSAVAYLKKQVGMVSLSLCQMTQEIMAWTELHAVEVFSRYIRKEENCGRPDKLPWLDYSNRMVTYLPSF